MVFWAMLVERSAKFATPFRRSVTDVLLEGVTGKVICRKAFDKRK